MNNQHPQDLQDRFATAWADLRERLTSGEQNLRDMAPTVSEAAQRDRLINKATGVQFAIDLWTDLANGALSATNDYAGMWRTFTDAAEARLSMRGYQPGYYQGVDLALSYQRGYGPEVDAPIIRNRRIG